MAPARVSTSRASRALETGEAKLWVLLIGVNQYDDEQLPSLRYPAMDCQGLGFALSQAAAFFPRTSITLHCTGEMTAAIAAIAPPQPPHLSSIQQSLDLLVEKAEAQDTVLVYFSGHGVLDSQASSQAVLCLEDTRTDALETTGLRLQALLADLNRCAARQQLLWLDACHSGSLTLRGSKDMAAVQADPTPQLIEVLRQRARQSKGFYALLSCDQQQRSWEFPELGHGVFSYFLMRGLLGEAANPQGVIEADALYKYVYYQTLRYIDTANQQLRLINQQRRHRGDTQLLSEYPLQTPKRIVEGVGELVLGVTHHPPALSSRQAVILTATPPAAELLSLSQRLQQQGGFVLHYWWPGRPEPLQNCLSQWLGQTDSAHTSPLETGTLLLYLQGTPEQTAAGEPLLRLGDEAGAEAISRSWLRQRLRHTAAQQVVILDGQYDADWVDDLQLNADGSQAILAGFAPENQFASQLLASLTAPEPESGLSIAGWIAQLQRQAADTDLVLLTWLSSPRVIEVLLGQQSSRGLAEPAGVDLGLCPYRGLRAFQVADAPYFCGREELIAQLMATVHRQALVAVVGASGSGKSSVVQAGLMAQLKQGQRIPGSDRWWLGCLRPGAEPISALAQALVDPGTEREQFYQQQQLEGVLYQGVEGFVHWLRSRAEPMVVLVIDQFEELFSLASESDRAPFLTLLLGALEHAGDRFKLVLTLRSDFVAPALENPALATLLPPATILVPPVLSVADYRQIILNPAEKVGLQVEPTLVDVLLRDLNQGIGSLPLLEFVLEQIWLERDSGILRLQTYQQSVGGLEGALERKAQAVYEGLDPDAQDCARWLFLSLTQMGDGTEDTRRRLLRRDLAVARYPAALVDFTLQAFVTAKLIVISTDDAPAPPQPKGTAPSPDSQQNSSPSPTIEVAHEILIRRWSTLRWWLDENRARLRSQRQIEQAAQQWHGSSQQPEYLLRGMRLAAATDLYVNYTDELSPFVQSFIEACITAQQRDQQRQQQQLRRARLAVGAISTLALMALGLGGLAYRQQQRTLASEIAALNSLAEAQWQSQQSLESLVTSVRAGQQLQRFRGFGLSRQVRASRRAQTLATLYQAVTQVSERNRLLGHSQPVNRAVFGPNGSRIATASDDGTVRLWRSNGERLRVLEGNGDRFTDVTFSPDGAVLAAASTDGSIWLWQVETAAEPTVLSAHGDWISRLDFSPDGKLLATASRDGTVRLWQVSNQQLVQTFSGHQGWVNVVQFSPNGERLASGGEDATLRLWEVATGKNLQTRRVQVEAPALEGNRINDLAFSPDGAFLVGASDQTLGIWSLADNTLTNLESDSPLTSIDVSPDSQLILTGERSGSLRLWGVASQETLVQLPGHSAAIHSVTFAHASTEPESPAVSQTVTLLSAGADNTSRLWATPVPPEALQLAGSSSYPIALHPDGTTYAIGGWEGDIILQSQNQRQTWSGHDSPVLTLAFSPSGKWLASGGDDATIRLWNGDGRAAQVLTGHGDRITSLAFSPDEERLLSGSADQTAIIWDLATGQSLQTFMAHQDELSAVDWSPDGQVLATGGADAVINLWQPSGQLLQTLDAHDLAISALAFSPDSKTLVSASWDRTLRLWRVADGTPLQTLTSPQEVVVRLRFTDDGYALVAEDRYGHIQLWNPATGALLATLNPAPGTLTPLLVPEEDVMLQPPLTLWQQLNQPDVLTSLLAEGCQHLADYLATATAASKDNQTLCDEF